MERGTVVDRFCAKARLLGHDGLKNEPGEAAGAVGRYAELIEGVGGGGGKNCWNRAGKPRRHEVGAQFAADGDAGDGERGDRG